MKWLDLPPLWLLLCLIVTWFSPWHLPSGALFWPGVFCLVVAAALVGAALAEFRRQRTTPIPHMTPSALITSGVFRLTRNPIYLADMLILLGFSLVWGKLGGLVLLPVLFVILQRRFIEPEEQRLLHQFPEDFAAYTQSTRRWL